MKLISKKYFFPTAMRLRRSNLISIFVGRISIVQRYVIRRNCMWFNNKPYFLTILLFLSTVCLFKPIYASTTQWKTLNKSFAYTRIYPTPEFPLGAIYAFKINLNSYYLDLALTHNTVRPMVSVKELVLNKKAVLGINGGFFSPQLKPLGLRIKQGKQISPLKPISWWGVFYIKNNKPYIVSQKNFYKNSRISFAVQSGPRLVINGKIPSLKPGWSNRSAIGITKNNEVIIAISKGLPITTKTLATIMQKPNSQGGLACRYALNLDGGSSSQLYAHLESFVLDIPSLSPVSDAILVYRKVKL